ncbi:venom carboxylesterase-6-like [Nasonia vitripennis]|uniref:Carboxylesterase type B domain-containing protein n=1 Tax=Nasonia vitripennis TaxID=7425 RepID=A0A7M7Q396_NASVI|nr:venom carboxylesterase-6-like [Nasonia vitripennis]
MGTVIGQYKTSYKGRLYEVYEGFPYAKPPTGSLRFEEPVPIGPWGILNATNSKSVCAQYFDIPPDKNGLPVTEGRVTGSDDCLYLSINVPVLEDTKRKLPVIFLIHGGSFQYGNGLTYGAKNKYLLDRDIGFVSINYRLGILGFLSTEDEVLPGNLGLKDQSLSLRWTSENIAYFGVDPNRIILVGYSAGSSSVQYHYLSPLSRGLFHGSIGLSGTVFNPWGFALGAREKARKLGAIFNCPTQDSRKLVNCLKGIPAQSLLAATKEFQYWQFMPEAPFTPVIEKADTRPFINKSPKEIANAKEVYDVPAVFGMVSDEGCDPGAGYAPHDNVLKDLNDNWISIAPHSHLLQYNYTLPRRLHKILAVAARKFYFGNKKINTTTASASIRMLSDKHHFTGIEQGVRLQAMVTKSPVYFYYYSFHGSQSRSEDLNHTKNNYGDAIAMIRFLYWKII